MRLFHHLPPLCRLLPMVFCCAIGHGQDMSALDALSGQALFERQWVPAPASTGASDGLGPFYNTRSCAGCHPAGGRGNPPDGRVLLLADPVYGRQLQTRAVTGLKAEARVDWDNRLHQRGLIQPVPELNELRFGPLTGPWSVRLAPSLQVVASMAAVPDRVLRSREDPDDRDGDGISGRVSLVSNEAGQQQIARFGWKATEITLAAQIARALSIDLGLSTTLYPSPWGDCTPQQTDCLAAPSGAGSDEVHEITAVITGLLETYLLSLRPEPSDARHQEEGLQIFRDIACDRCHVEEFDQQLEQVNIWSDLLLHDMGTDLDDGFSTANARAGEWRTAPLAGLGDGPFLHDGRARTLEEAILWHGGEAEAASRAFQQLGREQKRRLSAFLNSL